MAAPSGYGDDGNNDQGNDKGETGNQYPPHNPRTNHPKPPTDHPKPPPTYPKPPTDHPKPPPHPKPTDTKSHPTHTRKTTTTTATTTKTEVVTKTTAPRAAAAELAKTGDNTTGYVVAGSAMVLGGAFLVGLARRRREEAAQEE